MKERSLSLIQYTVKIVSCYFYVGQLLLFFSLLQIYLVTHEYITNAIYTEQQPIFFI